MKKFLLFALLALGFAVPANAQQASSAFIVSSCGTLPAGVTYAVGQFGILTMDTTGKLCDSATGGGGGGGAVTLAAGSVSAGAYVAGAAVDGWDLTQGTKADAAWVSGPGSVIALLKNMAGGIAGAIPDCGAVPCANRIGVAGINTWAAGVLGAMANYGTSPGAVLVPGVNAFITNAPVLGAGSAIVGKLGIDQTTPGTTNNVTVGSVNSSPTNISAATSGTPSTATTLLAASATHQKVVIKVEGATAVCFSQFGTAVIGATGTWCLKGASTANAGDGGSYVTPVGMSEPNAISMISTGTSILVTGWWQ